ncbi:hypothetical protein V1511DRAFT_484037 [Dipodascopsis uninucleata]
MCLNVGLVGTGIFARLAHLPSIEKIPLLKITGVYNRTKAKAIAYVEETKLNSVTVYDDLAALINDSAIDVVDAILPMQFNLDVVTRAIQAGKPIAFEKPIAPNLTDARKIVELAESTSVPVMVLENYLYHNSIDLINQILPRIGESVTFMYQVTLSFAPNVYHSTAWRQKHENAAGYISDGGVHEIALLTEVLGEVESVSARASQLRDFVGAVDTVNSLINLKSGVYGSFMYSTNLGATNDKVEFSIYGTKGSIVYERFMRSSEPTKVTLFEGESGTEFSQNVYIVDNDEVNGVVRELENFADAVEHKDKTRIKATPRKAFHHFAVFEALTRSAQNGAALTKVEVL